MTEGIKKDINCSLKTDEAKETADVSLGRWLGYTVKAGSLSSVPIIGCVTLPVFLHWTFLVYK